MAVKAGRGSADDVAADALYQQAGVIRVDTVRELFDVGRVLASQPLPGGDRVAVVTNALSPAVLALDGLRASGLVPAELSVDTRAELHRQLADDVIVGNPIDLTYRSVPADYRAALEAVLGRPGRRCGPGHLRAAARRRCATTWPARWPLVDEGAGQADPRRDSSATTTVRCCRAARCRPSPSPSRPRPPSDGWSRYAAWRARPEGAVPQLDGVDPEAARAVVAHALDVRPEGTLLPMPVTEDLLAAYGIPVAPARGVTSARRRRWRRPRSSATRSP